jgi:hypothetical protein
MAYALGRTDRTFEEGLLPHEKPYNSSLGRDHQGGEFPGVPHDRQATGTFLDDVESKRDEDSRLGKG